MSTMQYDGTVPDSAENGFWFVCTGDGKITLCSDAASQFGLVTGSDAVSEVVCEEHIPDFEDVISITSNGGSVSVLLNATSKTGYSLAHICSGTLFDAPVAIVRLYKNKNEYLADSLKVNEGIGRVFGYKDKRKNDDGLLFAEHGNTESDILKFEQSMIRHIMNVSVTESAGRSDVSELIDVSKVFDMIGAEYESADDKPFDVIFENVYKGVHVISNVSRGNFTGIVLVSAAIAARLSESRMCKVSLRVDGDAVTVFAESKIGRSYSAYFRSCELAWLHLILGKSPSELLMLEHLLSFPGRDLEFRCDTNGDFGFSVTFTEKADVDRFKYRDCTLGVKTITAEYVDFLRESFSSDPQ